MPQVRVGWRANTGQAQAAQSVSTLLASLYGAWNGDAATNELGASLFGAWNGEAINNLVVKNAWNANGNANDSKGGANGTVAIPSGTTFTTGSMTYSAGKLGSGAFTFDGTNFINLPDNTLKFTGDFSISCWFYVPVNYVANGSLVSAFDNKSSYTTYYGWNFSYDSTNKCIGFSIGNPAGGSYANVALSTPNNSIVPGQWNHVIVTRKMSTRSSIYINGVLSASNTSTMNPTYSFGLSYIGAIFYAFSQPYYNKPNAGLKIDSIYTFEAELDATAVSELYNSGTGQEYPFTISNALISTPIDNVGTNHGTLQGGATYTTGKIGSAFSFNGSTSYVQLPTDSFKPTGNFAVSFWLNLYSLNAVRSVFSNCSQSNMGFRVTIGSNNKINFEYNGYSFVSNSTLTSNTWYHICVMNTGTTYEIYINGALDRTNAGSSLWYAINWAATGNLFYIGRYVTAAYYLNGEVDSFTLWNRSLSKDEITQLYNSGAGAQYPFSGTFSSAGNVLGMDNGTLIGGCYLSDGKIGKAFTFDGVNDYVSLPNNSLNFTGDFSVSLWLYRQPLAGGMLVSNWYNGSTPFGWYVYNTNGVINFLLGNGTSSPVCNINSSLLTSNVWNFVTITKTATSAKIYINGVLNTSATLSSSVVYTTTHYPMIGAAKYDTGLPSYYMENGSKLDAVNVWQKELTQAEVTELYNSGNGKQITATPIVQAGLVLNLDASRKSSYPAIGATWSDISGSGNNGTMVNSPVFGTASDGQISFNGTNQYVAIPDSTTNRFGNQFSMSLSFYWDGVSRTNNNLFAKRNADPYNSYTFAINNGDAYNGGTGRTFMFFGRADLNTADVLLTYDLGTTPRNIIATVVIDVNSQKLFINGTIVANAAVNLAGKTFNVTGRQLVIGATRDNASGYFNYANTKIYSAQLYNRSLADSEVLQNFNSYKTRLGL